MTILASVLLGVGLGYVAFVYRLCAVVAADEITRRDFSFLKTFALVALLCLTVLPVCWATGLVSAGQTQEWMPFGALAGGALFGYSASFARGSVVGLLYRIGAGRLHALAAFGVMTVSAAFAAEFFARYPIPIVTESWTIPAIGASPLGNELWWITSIAFGALAAAFLWATRTEDPEASDARAWKTAGFMLSAIVVLTWLLSGDFGASQGPEDLPAMQEIASVLGASVASGNEWMAGLAFGVVLGAMLASLQRGKFRLRWPRFADPFESVLGGIGMGIGIALASGGSMTHLYAGPSGLAANTPFFLLGMFPLLILGYRHREDRRSKQKSARGRGPGKKAASGRSKSRKR